MVQPNPEGTLNERIAFFEERVMTFSQIVFGGGNIARTKPSLDAAKAELDRLLNLQAQTLTDEQERGMIEGKPQNNLLIPAIIIGAILLL